MGTCAYCGEDARLTREHLIPDWYAKIYPRSEADAFIQRLRSKGRRLDMRISDVCERCNNGPLSDLDHYAKSLYETSLRETLHQGESRLLSYDFHRLAKWIIKVSYNVARANKSEARVLSQYVPLVISKDPLPPKIRLFCQAVGPAMPGVEGLPRVALRGEDSAMQPKGLRVGRLMLGKFSDYRWCLRRLTLDGFEFRLILPDQTADFSESDLEGLNGALKEASILEGELSTSGATTVGPPTIDAATFRLGHERQFPVHYGFESDDLLKSINEDSAEPVHVVAGKLDVDEENFGSVDLLIRASEVCELAEALAERVEFVVIGYEDDPRELWEIPEVRAFLVELDRRFSAWMFYQSPQGVWLKVLFACLASRINTNGQPEIDPDMAVEIIHRWFGALNVVADRFGIPERKIKEISERSAAQLMGVVAGVMTQ